MTGGADGEGGGESHGRNSSARTLLVAGTASHVGKSTVAAGLCRVLADHGVSVAPFKAQNMSNNARAVPKSVDTNGTGAVDTTNTAGAADSTGFGEVGVSQYVQARAARVRPETNHNPVLLKPRGGGESQLVLNGEAVAHYAAGDYYEEHWHDARAAAVAAHARLASAHDVVVAEGAGSIAEINLQHRDLANVETARVADAEILLVADIERGGVFASLVGTLELLPDDLRERVVGAVVTKFRGDRSLLTPGIEEFEDRTDVPVLGVIPHDDPGLPEEDSVALPAPDERAVRGADDGVPAELAVTVAVPRLPRASNVTDLEPLAAEPGVRVAYVPVRDTDRENGPTAADPFADADAVVIPGTKNTVDDLLALREAGLVDALRHVEGPVVGLCGGYQILGERILRADVEGTGDRETVAGVGLLPVETAFSADKRVVATTLEVDGTGPLAGASGAVEGYEIHMGETRLAPGTDEGAVRIPFAPGRDGPGREDREGAALGVAVDRGGDRAGVLGTYLHGLFENDETREAFVDAVFTAAGRDRAAALARADADAAGSAHDRAADLLCDHVDLGALDLTDDDRSNDDRSDGDLLDGRRGDNF
ncbi:cobyric acid synthase [Haloparvum sedimenti]|uniref:cobyric acid synthase n=1 Tax=Haloparvum sedimenti TaxID=1678448 RepID=UPI00071E8D6B|nr:cobyric acid synthase [Haloparvum sedimenti]